MEVEAGLCGLSFHLQFNFKKVKHEKLWLFTATSPFPKPHTLLAILPKNEKYAVYVSDSEQMPIRVYLPDVSEYSLSEEAANAEAVRRAQYVISELQPAIPA